MKLTIINKDQFEIDYSFNVQAIKQHTLRQITSYLFHLKCLISLFQEQTTLLIVSLTICGAYQL